MTDYYDILEIPRDANQEDIKKAYRKKAMQYHPDKGGDESIFKQVQEAYEILSDEQKKASYDRFGSAGGGTNDFFDFNDLFSSFGMNSPFNQRRKAQDIKVILSLNINEIINGATKKIKYNKRTTCDGCSGTGAESFDTCTTCRGSGQILEVTSTFMGQMRRISTCPNCKGAGKVILKTCRKCSGSTTLSRDEEIELNIPIGCVSGNILSMSGAGHQAKEHIPGDLHIIIQEQPIENVVRDGLNLVMETYISIADAVLGTTISIEAPTGNFRLFVPSGCESGKILNIKGKGIPSQGGKSYGDLLIRILVNIPKTLTQEQRDIFEQLKNLEYR